MKENKLTDLEKALRDKLDGVDFPYQDSDWSTLEQALPKSKSPFWSKLGFKIAAGALIVAGTYGLFNSLSDSKEQGISAPEKALEIQEQKTQKTKPSIHSAQKEPIPSIDSQIKDEETAESQETISSEIEFAEEEIVLPVSDTLIQIKENAAPELADAKQETAEILAIEYDGSRCLGDFVNFTAMLNEEPESSAFQWTYNGKPMEVHGQSIRVRIDSIGTNRIELSYKQASSSSKFEVAALPQVDFRYEDNTDPYLDETVRLIASPSDLDYEWDIEGLDHITGNSDIQVNFGSYGLHDVELSYQNEEGCIASIRKPVLVEMDFDPLAPNYFTPNGDGINDEFIPLGFETLAGEFKFYIFNEEGRLVFMSQSRKNAWNGKENNSGRELSEGNYVWKVEMNNEDYHRAFTGKVKLNISGF